MLDKKLRSFASDVWHVKLTNVNQPKNQRKNETKKKESLFPFRDGGDCQGN